MDLLFILSISLIIFGLIIAIHEFGHFVAAKLIGVKVVSFSIGFGPRLWKKRIGETTFCISVLPLGGYVIPVSKKNSGTKKEPIKLIKWLIPLSKEELEIAKELSMLPAVSLTDASFSKKLFFFLNGLNFNVLFAFLIYIFAFYQYGQISTYVPEPRIGKVQEGSLADIAGLKQNDLILKVNDTKIESWKDWRSIVYTSGEGKYNLTISRSINGKDSELPINYYLKKKGDSSLDKPVWDIGFSAYYHSRPMNFTEVIKNSALSIKDSTIFLVKSILRIQKSNAQEKEDSAGIDNWGLVSNFVNVGIYGSKSFKHFIGILVGLSLVVVIFNAIPYPAFDGGQILLLIIEKIKGKELSCLLKERIAYFGLASSLLLIVAALCSDFIWLWNN